MLQCFPEKLTDSECEDMVYDLMSILLHYGHDADSGHYVSVVKDSNTQTTYRFSDEKVQKLAETTFRLETKEVAGNPRLMLLKPKCKIDVMC